MATGNGHSPAPARSGAVVIATRRPGVVEALRVEALTDVLVDGGRVTALPGWWIVRDPTSGVRVMPPDRFAAEYRT